MFLTFSFNLKTPLIMWCTFMINHFWTTVGPMNLGMSVCPSVHLLRAFFSWITALRIFLILYMVCILIKVGWSDRALFQDKIQIWPIMAENGHKKPKITLVEMIFYHSMQTTCPGKFWFSSYGLKNSRPIRSLDYFFRLWQRTTLRNFLKFYMIVEMILYHHVQIACRGKFWFLSYDPKSPWSIRLLDYFFRLWQRTSVRNFLHFYMIVEMILYHHVQTACPGKLWFLSYDPKSFWLIRLLDYFFRFWQRTAVRNFLNFYMMIVEMILYHHIQTACPEKSWFHSYGPVSFSLLLILSH